MITYPPAISIKLWWKLVTQDQTLLRILENSCIDGLELRGKTLDIGGGQGFGYTEHIKFIGQLDSINISAATRPTHIWDLNTPLPFKDCAYDNVICFNTLEHIYEERLIASEMLRILRVNGKFIVTIPFIFRRHGNYSDFHRHTAEYWERLLCETGLSTIDFQIKPLAVGPLSSGLTTLPWFRGGLRGVISKFVILFFETWWCRKKNIKCEDYALGFYIEGIKAR